MTIQEKLTDLILEVVESEEERQHWLAIARESSNEDAEKLVAMFERQAIEKEAMANDHGFEQAQLANQFDQQWEKLEAEMNAAINPASIPVPDKAAEMPLATDVAPTISAETPIASQPVIATEPQLATPMMSQPPTPIEAPAPIAPQPTPVTAAPTPEEINAYFASNQSPAPILQPEPKIEPIMPPAAAPVPPLAQPPLPPVAQA